MKWLKANLLVIVSSMLLTACAAGTEPDEFDDVASAEEDTAEAASALVEYGNHCEGGYCYTFKWECDSTGCTLTVLSIYVEPTEEPCEP